MHGTAQEVADKWATNIGNATTSMKNGVARVTVAPGEAAAQKAAKWQQAMQDPATFTKWQNNVRRVSLGSWQQSMNDIGIARVAAGAQAKKAKFEQAMNSLLQHIDAGVQQIKSMPDTTFEERLARSTAMQRWMHSYQRPAA